METSSRLVCYVLYLSMISSLLFLFFQILLITVLALEMERSTTLQRGRLQPLLQLLSQNFCSFLSIFSIFILFCLVVDGDGYYKIHVQLVFYGDLTRERFFLTNLIKIHKFLS